MLTRIRQFLSAPVFEDPEKTRSSRLLNDMLNAILGMALVAAVVLIATQSASFFEDWYSPAIILIVIAATLLLRFL